MTSKTSSAQNPPSAATDTGFKRAIVFSTVILLATVFGWLACLLRTEQGDVEFHWQWRSLLWIAVGIGSTVYFWRQVWPTETDAPMRKQPIKGWVVLAIPCLMWMAYPLQFISGQQLLNVAIGLTVAATVLTGGGWMVFKLIKGFENDEAIAAEEDLAVQRDSKNLHPEPNPVSAPAKTLGREP